MKFGIAIPTDSDSWRLVRRAEELGFHNAWFYDTQMLCADCFVAMGAAAVGLTGQRQFSDKGDNRWAPPCRDSLCWPYGVSACGRRLVVADSGNNRVMLWETAL